MRFLLSPGRWIRLAVTTAIGLIVLQVVFAIIGPPERLVQWLECTELAPRQTPRYIVVLGGGGMPSQSTLIRLYCAARFGQELTNATFVVSLPADRDPNHAGVGRMRDELIMRGIPPAAIQMETTGRNTRQEALNIAQMLGFDALEENILIVSSDFHLRRAVLLFRKAGFKHVSALSAHTIDAEADPGPWTWLRYEVWRNAEIEIRVLREVIAIVACKFCGWI